MILVLDFGSQYTQLIARRIRESNVYCEIHPFNYALEKIKALKPEGIILSGGPASVYQENAPNVEKDLFQMPVPFLGICYGMGIINLASGGEVGRADRREYGPADVIIDDDTDLFRGLSRPNLVRVWMSHGDRMTSIPKGWTILAHSNNSPIAAFANPSRRFFGVQFHPEVVHTLRGKEILENFVFRICDSKPTWTMQHFVETSVKTIREQVGAGRVICALSGGVDSSVAATLVHRAIGDRLICVFVNNGLLRLNEAERVCALFSERFGASFRYVDASVSFLTALRNVEDPEQKRKVIGRIFIEVFEEQARKLGGISFLAQGTLYPDVIESVSFVGPSATIKSHHNVGGLPEKMRLKLIEPLRELFKDEARQVGCELGLPKELIQRQPFPGPGLAIRVLGQVTEERLTILRDADAIVLQEIRDAGLYDKVWQSFAVLLPIRTVGVMGDERSYENVIALRVVDSLDGMTADWVSLPAELLSRISNRIINEVRGVNRVVYDISSKPPATIEWE
ncbi:MAG TPA: glutamine-hydrolyzing GMP synthase [Candidatus Udaeobacter sp.]|jgi:GMP synthase (glutamine-hydrolysing)|nr:glutamine-hydrolyzing GMP synthase [Candidatus Udaeobacter sp.]